ncbi:MAG: GNAT family N-acetyltransferase [Verrucomicrobia subdivision 3 bacterium]|nr:GNAT family N-acetyltransferase [Limisphaerales bacterium]
MGRYAQYEKGASRVRQLPAPRGLVIESAGNADLPEIAAICAERDGSTVGKPLTAFQRFLQRSWETEECMLWLARWRGRVIGFAKCGRFVPPNDAPLNSAPEGWYLLGLVVVPEYRRRGVGFQLTKTRLGWIATRSATAYYFANAKNRVSIALHSRLGFRELTRDFSFPGAEFDGGTGVLYVWRRACV